MLRIWAVIAALLLAGCYYTPVPLPRYVPPQHATAAHAHRHQVYTVRPGDTLYSIAKRFGVHYKLLARRNRVSYPYTIYVGQELSLHRTALPSSVIPTPAPRRHHAKRAHRHHRSTTRPRHVDVSPPDRSFGRVHFAWPVKGRVTSPFGTRHHRRHDGIDIAATRGAPVHAAAAGKVVYADHRIAGYGRLIIIRHAGDFFTAYAHNARNLVKRGEHVKKGEVIARVGKSGRATSPHLHFEIRRGATPVNPLAYLPRR